MKSCGIIAEYNPFHNGHHYQLVEARRQSGADVLVVAMSGNFTQRGEPAIFDKWQRAKTALENGADLVVEQSVLGSVQATDLFARSNVRLLQALACDYVSFGAEDGTSQALTDLAEGLVEKEAAINQAFQSSKNDGRTYAFQMMEAIQKVVGPTTIDLAQPNNQLALGYLKENFHYPKPMQAIAVPRVGAGHNESKANPACLASGTSIRLLLLAQEYANLGQWVPNAQELANSNPTSWETYWPLLRYQILLQDHASLRLIYQMEEGIEHRLKKYVSKVDSFHGFINLVKNKRWTWVRLQRLCVYILLKITRDEVTAFFSRQPVIRILGFNEKGRSYLNHLKRGKDLAIVTNLNKQTASSLSVEIRADNIYQLNGGNEQSFSRMPIIIP